MHRNPPVSPSLLQVWRYGETCFTIYVQSLHENSSRGHGPRMCCCLCIVCPLPMEGVPVQHHCMMIAARNPRHPPHGTSVRHESRQTVEFFASAQVYISLPARHFTEFEVHVTKYTAFSYGQVTFGRSSLSGFSRYNTIHGVLMLTQGSLGDSKRQGKRYCPLHQLSGATPWRRGRK